MACGTLWSHVREASRLFPLFSARVLGQRVEFATPRAASGWCPGIIAEGLTTGVESSEVLSTAINCSEGGPHATTCPGYFRVCQCRIAQTLSTLAHTSVTEVTAGFVMHVRYGSWLTWVFVAAGVAWLEHMLIVTRSDYLTCGTAPGW